ncbi:hypothetical protein [Microbacterium sp.]|uniref:hypothetical protein n=1 Tax=Microbacterium sp. TaxID=51671 RepID=UPI0031FF4090|nr:hypothetical protein [Microbacterium sp.]
MTDELEFDFDLPSDFENPETPEAPAEPERPKPNRFEWVGDGTIDKLARRAVEASQMGLRGDEAQAYIDGEPIGEPEGYGIWADVPEDEFERLIEMSKRVPEELDWDTPAKTEAEERMRREILARDAGIDGDLAAVYLAGEMALEDAVAQHEGAREAAELINAQPEGLTESLSDAEFAELLDAAKLGDGPARARGFARQKGLVH